MYIIGEGKETRPTACRMTVLWRSPKIVTALTISLLIKRMMLVWHLVVTKWNKYYLSFSKSLSIFTCCPDGHEMCRKITEQYTFQMNCALIWSACFECCHLLWSAVPDTRLILLRLQLHAPTVSVISELICQISTYINDPLTSNVWDLLCKGKGAEFAVSARVLFCLWLGTFTRLSPLHEQRSPPQTPSGAVTGLEMKPGGIFLWKHIKSDDFGSLWRETLKIWDKTHTCIWNVFWWTPRPKPAGLCCSLKMFRLYND